MSATPAFEQPLDSSSKIFKDSYLNQGENKEILGKLLARFANRSVFRRAIEAAVCSVTLQAENRPNPDKYRKENDARHLVWCVEKTLSSDRGDYDTPLNYFLGLVGLALFPCASGFAHKDMVLIPSDDFVVGDLGFRSCADCHNKWRVACKTK